MSLTQTQTHTATLDYHEFFRRYPGARNPTDLNTKEKFLYACEIGWERHRAMERARKFGHPFTKPEYTND